MNRALLEYEMKTKGVSKDELCRKLGIAPVTFYRKCTGRSEFTLDEIKIITEVLRLESPMAIFFANEVS